MRKECVLLIHKTVDFKGSGQSPCAAQTSCKVLHIFSTQAWVSNSWPNDITPFPVDTSAPPIHNLELLKYLFEKVLHELNMNN